MTNFGTKVWKWGYSERPFSVRLVGPRRSSPRLILIGLYCGCCNFYSVENTSQRLRRNSHKNSKFLDLNVRNVQKKSFEISGAVMIYRTCRLVVGVSGRQASEQVALGYDGVWLLRRRTWCSVLCYCTLKMEARSSAVAELPKTFFLVITKTQLYECWVQAIGRWLKNCFFRVK
jgi:hypothetical protein